MAIGTIAMPEHKRLGSDSKLATGSLAAGGSLGILIPPSLCGIFYCIISEQSIGHLFVAGVVPGFMTAGAFILYIILRCKYNPRLMPTLHSVSWRERWQSLGGIIPPLLIVFTVMGTIYLGIATPTEAGGLGCMSAIVLGLATRRLGWKDLLNAGRTTARLTGFLMLIVIAAIAFGVALNRANVGNELMDMVLRLGYSKWGVLILMQLIWFMMGCFMDPTPIVLTTMPTFYPIAYSLGFDPIWFGIIAIMNLELAAITPPVGFNLFVIKEVSGDYASMGDIIIGAIPFGIIYIISLLLVIIFPSIALFLPNLM
jgi:tripartite ATP-independent transporter DctM subunit